MSKIYVNTNNSSLIRESQLQSIFRGITWKTGPVNEKRMVKTIPPSQWAWLLISSNEMSTTNKAPNTLETN